MNLTFAQAPGLPAQALDPFALGNRTTVRAILDASSFVDTTFIEVHEPVYYGHTVTTACRWVRGFSVVTETLQRLEPGSVERVLERLSDALGARER